MSRCPADHRAFGSAGYKMTISAAEERVVHGLQQRRGNRMRDRDRLSRGVTNGMGAGWLACIVAATSLAACTGRGSTSGGSVVPPGDAYSITVEALTSSSLPKCSSSLAGTTAYVQSPVSLYSCQGSAWVPIPCATLVAGAVAYATASQTLLACGS